MSVVVGSGVSGVSNLSNLLTGLSPQLPSIALQIQQSYISDVRSRCLTSLASYWRLVWPVLEPSRPLAWNWHLDEICDALESVTRRKENGEHPRTIINCPPGIGKSVGVSVIWPSWMWARNASLRFLTFSYSDKNTIRDNLNTRNIVTSKLYRDMFWESYRDPSSVNAGINPQPVRPVTLANDQNAKVRFDTSERGWRIASSVGGQGTGDHPDYLIIDDPVKARDARYANALTYANTWLDETVSTRIALDPAIVLIMQRLSMFDPTAHALEKGGWEHIVFPMRFRRTVIDLGNGEKPRLYSCPCHAYEPDKRDHRTVEGELLWEDKWPEDKVKHEEIQLGMFGKAGQLQQEPVPPGGALFKRSWFKFVDVGPVDVPGVVAVPGVHPGSPGIRVRRCRGWDTADTPDGGDWTSGVRLALTSEGQIYVEDDVREQSGPGGVDKLIAAVAASDGRGVMVREGSGSGKATIAARTLMLAGYDYAPMPETVGTGDKTARANPFRAQCESGNVYVVRGEWNTAWLNVMCNFTGMDGEDDDDVDATSNAYNGLVVAPVKKKVVGVMIQSRYR